MILLSCPDLVPLQDKNRDTLVRKLDELAGTYYRCRAAALAQEKP